MEIINDKNLQKQIDSYIANENNEKAKASFNPEQQLQFLKDYYQNDNFDYQKILKTRSEEGKKTVSKELKENPKPPYSEELVNATIDIAKMKVMDEVVKKAKPLYSTIREKLKNKDILDFKSTMVFQLSMGSLAMEYNQLLTKQLEIILKENSINNEEFMKKAFPHLTGDFFLFTEIDSFYCLSIFQEFKGKSVDEKTIEAYMKRLDEYSKHIITGKLSPQATMVFPNLINHFLYNEFGLENIQVTHSLTSLVQTKEFKANANLQSILLSALYTYEKARKMISEVFESQVKLMGSVMDGKEEKEAEGLEDSEVFPSLMQGVMGNKLNNPDKPFDPSLLTSNLTNFESNNMPNMEEMAKVMENLDFDKFEDFLPDLEKMIRGKEDAKK